MNQQTLLIRADATIAIGMGHVMRCLALAQAWQDAGGIVLFFMAQPSSAMRQRLVAERIEVVELASGPGSPDDAEELLDLAQARNAQWIVVDGYHFDAAYQRRIKDGGRKLLFIDDMGKAEPYCADIVLNQNLHAAATMYSRERYTQLLLGAPYILLRRNFTARPRRDRIGRDASRLLVSMGGSDPGNLTAKILQALKKLNLPAWEAIAVIGEDNEFSQSLSDTILTNRLPVQLSENPPNMAELMEWSDFAVSAGGTTIWELAFMGVPTLAITRGEQERMLMSAAAAREIAIDLGAFQSIDSIEIKRAVESLAHDTDRRLRMSKAGPALSDGRGASRVVNAMNDF
ncbi:MAG TPA: UDP-2,4-diacetamido-2,4,6-trideoxy-beta-L-altropyranose hydrolase [Candidatus Sulfotelmatobacter sp.]